ncbi:MAG: hypothetical protein HJJLKODD_01701 [Phycisphaerae bacterium]|nr:hypothetical protein [Phycisphaerae bacterium]
MASQLVKDLIESGVHFGHKASRWNPKMQPYILGKRNTVHIVNIKETVRGLLQANKFIAQVVSQGQDILFVGTKRQARLAIRTAADKCGMHYVIERWLGGTLTNFRTIRSRLSRLEELEKLEETGQLFEESKKTISRLSREKRKILRNLEGIRKMSKLPGALVIVDARHEVNAIHEARKLHIPTICLIDTDSDPDLVDIAIPGNDDAIRAIEIVIQTLAEAVELGKRTRSTESEPTSAASAAGALQRKRSRRPTTTQLADQSTGADTADSMTTGAGPNGDHTVVMSSAAESEMPLAREVVPTPVEASRTS